MKIAIAGKGGVGKTLLAGLLAKLFVGRGQRVFAIDADPDSNFGLTLGFSGIEKITPLIKMQGLIEERTGAKPGAAAPYFKLNPKVDDIPDKYFVTQDGISLAVLGTVRGGGLGCACPENAFLKALLRHIIVERDEVVILDMEAGLEHLGRGTVEAVDKLIIVVEPGMKSIETARRVEKLSRDIGITSLGVVGNKVRGDADKDFILKNTAALDFLGWLPYNGKIIDADLSNTPFFKACPEILDEGKKIIERLVRNESR